MKILDNIQGTREVMQVFRDRKNYIALVPTMGNLHAGHLSLVKKAQEKTDCVIASIFVNPLQFAEHEDFGKYPRTLQNDLELLHDAGVKAVFLPQDADMYPKPREETTVVYVPELSKELCGVTRPHFFQGVATVVAKLFNIIQPNMAIFGEKDYQQLVVVKQLTQDLCFPIEILSGATVREDNGLALSSRNQYLSATERKIAPELYKELVSIAKNIAQGHLDFSGMENNAVTALAQKGFKPDYVSIRRREDLKKPTVNDKELIVLAAALLGTTRLIDNIFVPQSL